jgi:flagellar assembly protein FliH
MLATAEQDAATIRAQAESEGRQAAERGIDEVIERRMDERVTQFRPALAKALDDLQFARHEWLAHWEKQAVQLALSIAATVIRHELRADPQIPLELAREALRLAAGSARMRILMNPADVAALAGSMDRLLAEFSSLASIELVADAAISHGGCRVETEHGFIDQQFEAQLARIAEELV